VDVVDLDVEIGGSAPPATEELDTGWLSSPRIAPGAVKTTSSASTLANPSMSWALNVSVPLSNASRAHGHEWLPSVGRV
jgi:hypothetical protein